VASSFERGLVLYVPHSLQKHCHGMPLQIPSFPVPGVNKREAEEDTELCVVETEEATEEEAKAGDEGAAENGEESEPPEMLDLIEGIEESKDSEALVKVLRDLSRRLHLSPEDRDLLSDFEGTNQLCAVLKSPPFEWQGEAMHAFCKVLPDICRTSNVNRGALRDSGAIDACVAFLRAGVDEKDEMRAISACIGLTALCTANDGNKKAAAQLRGDFNEEELVETDADYRTPLFKAPDQLGALDLLLKALSEFPASVPLQTQGCAALRILLCDDDDRQASCVPSAVENRERAVNDEHFPGYRAAVERALGLEASGKAFLRLREQAMLLLREISCRQDRIHELVFKAKLLPLIEASLKDGDERVVRASLAVIRAFAFSDDLKEQLAVESDVALRCVAAVQKHMDCPPIVEQGFGLFANLTMRKPHIADRLNGPEYRMFAVGLLVLSKYRQKPSVVRSVVQTLRNVATQQEAAALEAKESDLFEQLHNLVVEHEAEAGKWRSPVEISKQFLREFRADEGLRKAATYNEFY